MSIDHAVDLLLWAVVLVLAVLAALRSRALLTEGLREGGLDFLRLLPRLIFGVVGAGFLAEILPQDIMVRWIGPDSGLLGVTIATLLGVVTPGGPVVGFAMAATAMKSGAGAPQVIAFVTAWSLYALQRVLVWEVPVLEPKVVWVRVIASLPLPYLAAAGAMLVGHP
jgi:uncharacterized membrane protein YraQ (UPF0718 family)